MKRRLRLATLAGWLVVLMLLGAYVQQALVVSSDLRLFLPEPRSAEQRLLLDEIGQGPASSLLIVSVSGAPPGTLAGVTSAMSASLRDDPVFRVVSNGNEDASRIPESLLPYRYLLTSSFDDRPLDAERLRQELRNRLMDLASPAAAMLEPWVRRDPTLEVLGLARSWQPETEPRRIDDAWFTSDGRTALLLAQTAGSGFDPGKQRAAIQALQAAFDAARGGSGARMTVTGAGAYSVMMEERTRRESTVIGVVDTLAMLALLVLAYRSGTAVALGTLPLLSGGVAGLAAVGAIYGAVHGITLAFGFTLIGVAQDYPIHLLSHRRRGTPPLTTARAIWPTLATGVASTCIAYLAFLFSGVNGLAQLAVFAISGLAVAGITTRLLLPRLMDEDAPDCADTPGLGRLWDWLESLPRPLWLAPALAVGCVGVLVAARGPMWEDDLGALTPVPRPLLELDARLRSELGAPDMRYLMVVVAPTAESALRRCEALAPRLAALVAEGRIAGYAEPARYLPSVATQQRRQAALPDPATLRADIHLATAGTPFRAGAFDEFLMEVEAARRLPALTPERLSGTPLEATVGALLRPSGDHWVALVTLRGVRDPAALEAVAAAESAVLLDLKTASEQLVVAQRDRILVSLALAGVLLIAVVWIALRSGARALRVLQPMALSTLLVLALLHASGSAISLFGLIALVLAAGLGLDYALFFEHASGDRREQLRTLHAVIVCSISTFVVFAVLAASSLPVLRGIGITVTLGVVANFLLALLLTRPRAPKVHERP
ncbi:MAG: MMPL family transporter [Steroidobacteraceae bacterium]